MATAIETHIALEQEEPIRLQEYGVGIFNILPTKSALKKALKKKLILVNGKLGTTATFIHGNEKITLHPQQKTTTTKHLILILDVVYEDDFLAVIQKPPGILVSGNSFKTITNALEQNLVKSKQVDSTKPQPVHRLDYATTGLLLIGKTSSAISALNKLFALKEITKSYYAVTLGTMQKEEIITSLIDDKKAETLYKVIKTVTSKRFTFLNLVKLTPKTGRRHQLRKHLFSLGNPILGDATYFKEDLILKGKGMYLHASSLKFKHPFLNKEMLIEGELPSRFRKLFEN